MPLLLSFAAILLLILLIILVKLDTFISFLIVSIGLGLSRGMNAGQISASMVKGIGSTLGSLVIILGFGAMLGRLVAESGAAQRITSSMTDLFGTRYIQWGMALAGLIVGIPMFYTAGFVVVIPLIFAIGSTMRLPLLYIGVPMLAALSVAHGFLPPHPSPTAISLMLHANLGKTLIYGIIVAIPAIILAGPVFGSTLKRFKPVPNPEILRVQTRPKSELPGLGISLTAALMPLILLTLTTSAGYFFHTGILGNVIAFIGDPNMAMLISVLMAIYLLGIRRNLSMSKVMKQIDEAFKGISVLLLIIAGSGVFMQVMSDAGVDVYIGNTLKGMHLSPLILAWAIAAIIRICIGSATVAGLTTVGIILPLVQQQHIHPELMVLSIGAGSLMFSHVNDGGFWLFKEYFNLSLRDTFATWSLMETIVSFTGLAGVLVLNHFI
ncbi:MAG TPA: gluconate:H+ symporter [Chitinophagaceae bacterium]|nr:gluconate:H+ symporter [Chitinophagaceae bacterium]